MNRILVFRPGAIGDTLLAIPAVQMLRDNLRPCHIEICGYQYVLSFLKKCGLVDNIISFGDPFLADLFSEGPDISPELAHYLDSFDIIIAWLKDPAGKIRKKFELLNRAKILIKDPLPPEKMPVYEYLRSSLSSLGIKDLSGDIPVSMPCADTAGAESVLKRFHNTRPITVVAPGSGSIYKTWPISYFIQTAKKMSDFSNILIVTGPAENMDLNRFSGIDSVVFAENLPLEVLAAVFRRSDLFIGNDSGISHLAGICGTASIVIFGPYDPDIWKPLGKKVRTLRADLSCMPCSPEKMHACAHRRCLYSIRPGEVTSQAVALLELE